MSSNAKAIQVLKELEAKLRGIKSDFSGSLVRAVDTIKQQAIEDFDAGHGLGDSQAWVAKKDGGMPLVNAGRKLEVSVHGDCVVFRLPHPYGIHQFGAGGMPFRPLLPQRLFGTAFKLGQAIAQGLIGDMPFMRDHMRAERKRFKADTVYGARYRKGKAVGGRKGSDITTERRERRSLAKAQKAAERRLQAAESRGSKKSAQRAKDRLDRVEAKQNELDARYGKPKSPKPGRRQHRRVHAK